MHQDLWAPWRMAYLRELEQRSAELGDDAPALNDFILHAWEHPELDRENHVIHRAEGGLIMLNRFPYSNGHILVALGVPRPRLLDHTPEEQAALWRLVSVGVDLLERVFAPHGVNIGVNQGDAAGAGLPQHLHVHVVPRWSGDVNFMSAVGNVRVIPDDLTDVATRYRDAVRTRAEVD